MGCQSTLPKGLYSSSDEVDLASSMVDAAAEAASTVFLWSKLPIRSMKEPPCHEHLGWNKERKWDLNGLPTRVQMHPSVIAFDVLSPSSVVAS